MENLRHSSDHCFGWFSAQDFASKEWDGQNLPAVTLILVASSKGLKKTTVMEETNIYHRIKKIGEGSFIF